MDSATRDLQNLGGSLSMIGKYSSSPKIFLGCVFALVLGVISISGQTVSGTLRGTISDSNGAAVPNATVVVTSTETGLERTATTSGEGSYNFAFLPIGTYRIVATRTD
ncbi:MAG TPA: carboxypeptidase-like regulatory domain-containing protein, partial [Pyrinomonadaceae bacterium]|nr:carboxypeptidase-like regulatory domain-containing protein [Pyrinomonadaceae bacterium]